MLTTRMLSAALLTATLTLATSGVAASAAPATTYDGTFGGKIAYDGCTTPAPRATTSGTWSVTLHGTSAKATFDILVNGQPHVAYTYPGMKQQPVEPPTVFSIQGTTQAGPLTVTLTGSHLTYTIAPYDFDGLSCASVTYRGAS